MSNDLSGDILMNPLCCGLACAIYTTGRFRRSLHSGSFAVRHAALVGDGFDLDARLHADHSAIDVASRACRRRAVERVAEPCAGCRGLERDRLAIADDLRLAARLRAFFVEAAVGIVLDDIPCEPLDEARLLG